ncbi:MAG: thioredoxin [Desulfobacterales bacterium CG23_combo_of_CG06-09_8_20_14_all_52_9]|nr:MAG: thioredoxin [Desulfobacterales bacterium CG23_combo_of_CG06-09_8_20_14_all_52_9]
MIIMKINSRWISFILLLLIPFFLTRASSAGTEAVSKVRWHTYSEGMALSKEENKKVFVYFWAEWCAYCTKMAKETFMNPDVVEYLNNSFVSIKVDYDREQNVVSQFGIRGLPTSFFINETGDQIGSRPGYISANDLTSTLKYIHTDSYKTMTLKMFLKNK